MHVKHQRFHLVADAFRLVVGEDDAAREYHILAAGRLAGVVEATRFYLPAVTHLYAQSCLVFKPSVQRHSRLDLGKVEDCLQRVQQGGEEISM